MKQNHRTGKPGHTMRAVIASLCVLGVTVHAAKKAEKFADPADLTAPVVQANAAVAQARETVAQANATVAPAVEAAPAAAPAAAPLPSPAAQSEPASSQAPEDKTVYSFQADNLDVRVALATFARANNLNIVPDNDIVGTVTVDVRNLPLKQMMRALLEASDCTWQEEDGLIRVRNTETRTFSIDYLRLSRKGLGQNSAMLGSGSSGGGGGMMGGGMGGGGGMMGGGGMGGSGGSGGITTVGNVMSSGSSTVNLNTENEVDFWKELSSELAFLLTASGKSSLAINKTAGIVQITDRPSALKRVDDYLRGVDGSIHRQVEIEAKLYDVTLNDQFEFGIDWLHMASAYDGMIGIGTSTLPAPVGSGQLGDATVGGLNRHYLPNGAPGVGSLTALVFTNFNTMVAITALEEQGNVEVISKPRLRTLNNQTALIKVGEEMPFFNTSTTLVPNGDTVTTLQESIVTSVTIGTILTITPQISADDWVSLDISPVLTSLKKIVQPPSSGEGGGSDSGSGSSTTAPNLETKQASTLVRVRSGVTVVLGGLIQTEEAKNERKVPFLGDIPLLGKLLFTGTYKSNRKRELVIFVTPRVISEGETSVKSDFPSRVNPPKKSKKSPNET